MTVATFQCSAKCGQCGTPLIVPEWSETISSERAVHVWHCPVCESEFETIDSCVERSPRVDDLVQEFLPNLLVA